MAAIAFGGAAFGEGSELLHSFSFGGFALTAFFALVGLAVERLCNCGRASDVGDAQNLNVEFAGFVPDAEHVADVDIAGGFSFDIV